MLRSVWTGGLVLWIRSPLGRFLQLIFSSSINTSVLLYKLFIPLHILSFRSSGWRRMLDRSTSSSFFSGLCGPVILALRLSRPCFLRCLKIWVSDFLMCQMFVCNRTVQKTEYIELKLFIFCCTLATIYRKILKCHKYEQ